MKCSLVLLIALISSGLAQAAEVKNVVEIGPHYPIFKFEKNENPQNVMVIFTKVDKACRIVRERGLPIFDFYWLMDRTRYKPVHAMIKQGIRKRLEVETDEPGKIDPRSFAVRINDLKELKHDLKSPRLQVIARPAGKGCAVDAFIGLGREDEKVRLETIFSVAKKTLLPPFRKVTSVTFQGVRVASGEEAEQTYLSKR